METGCGRGRTKGRSDFRQSPSFCLIGRGRSRIETTPRSLCFLRGRSWAFAFLYQPSLAKGHPGAVAPGTWHSQQWLQLPGPEERGVHWLVKARTQKPREKPRNGHRHLRAPIASSIFWLHSCRSVTMCPRFHMQKFTFSESWGGTLVIHLYLVNVALLPGNKFFQW